MKTIAILHHADNLFWRGIFAAFAEFERELIADRTQARLAAAGAIVWAVGRAR